MKVRPVVFTTLLGCLLTAGCNSGTPAQKAVAMDAQGRELVLKGEYPQAITIYSKAISNDDQNGSVFFHRGTARMLDSAAGGSSDLNDAIADFDTAIRLDPGVRRSAYHARGDAKRMKGDEAGATEDWAIGDKLSQ